MKLIIKGKPFSKQSFRFTKSGRTYQTAKIKKAEENIKWQIKSQFKGAPIPKGRGLKVVRLLYVFPPLASFSKKKLKELENGKLFYKIGRPDLTDNLNKGLFDAMNGVIYEDDGQICRIDNVIKCYGLDPRTEIEIEEI